MLSYTSRSSGSPTLFHGHSVRSVWWWAYKYTCIHVCFHCRCMREQINLFLIYIDHSHRLFAWRKHTMILSGRVDGRDLYPYSDLFHRQRSKDVLSSKDGFDLFTFQLFLSLNSSIKIRQEVYCKLQGSFCLFKTLCALIDLLSLENMPVKHDTPLDTFWLL